MSVCLKSADDLQKMREAGRMAAEVLTMIEPHVQPGVTTEQLDDICHQHIVEQQSAIPACLGYNDFPKSICTSVNHVVCHGIPGPRKLKRGDIVNIDVTVIHEGFHGDTSKMYFVGDCTGLAKRLVRVTQEAMYMAIDCVRPGAFLGDIGAIIQAHAKKHHFSVVREYCGHGIGRVFHEPELQVLHYGTAGQGLMIEPGMTFTIEPMLNAGRRKVKLLNDDWTVITRDRSLSAQWEHTIAVTETGYEVLTLRDEESLTDIKQSFA